MPSSPRNEARGEGRQLSAVDILRAYAAIGPGQWCVPKDVHGRPREMHGSTLWALVHRGLLRKRPSRKRSAYQITEAGRALLASTPEPTP